MIAAPLPDFSSQNDLQAILGKAIAGDPVRGAIDALGWCAHPTNHDGAAKMALEHDSKMFPDITAWLGVPIWNEFLLPEIKPGLPGHITGIDAERLKCRASLSVTTVVTAQKAPNPPTKIAKHRPALIISG